MSKTLLAAGVAALVAWTAVGAEPAGISESKPTAVQASALSALDGLQIQEAGRSGSTVVWIEVVNASPGPLDLSQVKIGDGAGKVLADVGLKLVRGSFLLETGDTALIVTHPAVPTDDDMRLRYDHLLVVSDVNGEGMSMDSGGITLTDAGGRIIDVIGPVAADAVGHCCNGNGSCFFGCDDDDCPAAYVCISAVTKGSCCSFLDGCCWNEDQTLTCSGPSNSACWGATGCETCFP